MLCGEKVLVTGATGQVAQAVAKDLAADNEVWGAARFSAPGSLRALSDAGVRAVRFDLLDLDMSGLPDDFTVVLNFAVLKTNDWSVDLEGNVAGLGRLMHRCRQARAFLQCSSTAVYRPRAHYPFKETDPLGDNMGLVKNRQTYSICKIAAEGMARYGATAHGLPTTIARLNVPYSEEGGMPARHLRSILAGEPIPVHPDQPNLYNPIHHADVVAMIPGLVAAASVPASVVNWGGSEAVSVEEWCSYLGALVGRAPVLQPTRQMMQSVAIDVTFMHQLVGMTTMPWQQGMQALVASAT